MAANCHNSRKYYATLRNARTYKWLLIVITHGNIMQPCVMRLGGGITQGCIIFPCVLTISSHLCPPKTGDIRHNSTIPDPETTLACQNGSLHCNTLACQNGSLHCNTLACQNGSLQCHTLACQNGSLHCNTLACQNGSLHCNT